jgi:hypothetical protein
MVMMTRTLHLHLHESARGERSGANHGVAVSRACESEGWVGGVRLDV